MATGATTASETTSPPTNWFSRCSEVRNLMTFRTRGPRIAPTAIPEPRAIEPRPASRSVFMVVLPHMALAQPCPDALLSAYETHIRVRVRGVQARPSAFQPAPGRRGGGHGTRGCPAPAAA